MATQFNRLGSPRALSGLSLAELDSVQLLLCGGSVIDWHRLNFRSDDEAHRFAAAQAIDLRCPTDVARVAAVRDAAVGYLRRAFRLPIPSAVSGLDLIGLLLLASGSGHRQRCACMILKAMHIIHHLDGRELLFALPVSDQQVFTLVEEKILHAIEGMLDAGYPVVEFGGGRKTRDALYTQLLSRRETIAAQVHDKLRFRIVTREAGDLLPVLVELQSSVFPFNYSVPLQTRNTLMSLRSHCEGHPQLRTLLEQLQHGAMLDARLDEAAAPGTDGAPRQLRFVADVPVLLPDEIVDVAPELVARLGRVGFVQTQFELLDRATLAMNEQGAASSRARESDRRKAVLRRLQLGNPG